MSHTSKSIQLFFKRIIDVFVSVSLLVLAAPLMVLTAAVIWISMGCPIFFVQDRPGLNGKIFKILKYRTMSNDRDARGELLPDEARLGKVGKFVRSTSIDELPQLLNVLIGKMSLIGPRPLLVEYLPLYSEKQALRHAMRPGITGYAQVNGRNELDWDKRLELDVWYINNWSLWLDFKIAVATILVVLKRKGVSQFGRETVDKFRGSLDS